MTNAINSRPQRKSHWFRTSLVIAAAAGLSACASAGAPPPGELVETTDCAMNELLVCPEKSGSRINKAYGTCYCQQVEQL